MIILGLTEEIKIKGNVIKARVDTGARRCSIDKFIAKKLKLGPIIGEREYRSANGRTHRPVIEEEIVLKGVKMKILINLANRGHMKYDFLIGREVLKKGEFLIDPNKK